MRRAVLQVVFLLALLPLLSGCPQVGTIRLGQDSPDNLGTLLENQEYARARLLTVKYPHIDTPEVQATITTLESTYENTSYEEARRLEAANDLHGAVQLLTDALQRVPNSVLLRALRHELERERVHQIKINERNKLLARAAYLVEQQQLYQQQANLQPPTFMQRREHSRNESEAKLLSGELVEHARYAVEIDDLEAARNCLDLSQQLQTNDAASVLLAEINKIELAKEENLRQAAINEKASLQRRQSSNEKKKTEQLLAKTQQALEDNKLQDARAALAEIPTSTSNDSDVLAAQSSVDKVVDSRVHKLLLEGDSLYRAEKILPALRAWTEALSLEPGNQEIRERIERANKVLANLEYLKRKQRK